MNVIKMICYRAETAVANILAENLARATEEKRMLVKQIIQSDADIEPDYQKNTLTITLHNLSANRYNIAVEKLIETLNQTKTIFPGSDLTMIFKLAGMSNCEK
jgi:DNA topoisomerase VI subunit B